MTKTERDQFVTRIAPNVKAAAQQMVPAEFVEDCYQAGLLELLRLAERNMLSVDGGWWGVRLSVSREILREWRRLRFPGTHVSFEELQDVGNDSDQDSEVDLAMVGNDRNEDLEYFRMRDDLIELIAALKNKNAQELMLLVLEGHTVSAAARKLRLSQSAADRLYQNTVVQLRASAGNSPSRTASYSREAS